MLCLAFSNWIKTETRKVSFSNWNFELLKHCACPCRGLVARKPVYGGLRATMVQTSPAHLSSLIGAFVIRLLLSFISRLDTSEITIFYLVSIVEEIGLNLAFSETPKAGFLASPPIYGQAYGLQHSFSLSNFLQKRLSKIRILYTHIHNHEETFKLNLYVSSEGSDETAPLCWLV